MTVELVETGISFCTSDGAATLRWSNIFQWRQNEKFILIYGMPVLYYILPKEIARNGFDVPQLLERLSEHVGPER